MKLKTFVFDTKPLNIKLRDCQFWSYMALILRFKWHKAARQLYSCLPALFYNISLIIL